MVWLVLFSYYSFFYSLNSLAPAELEATLADNYTCAVRNPWGEERGAWELRAASPLARPRLRTAAVAPAALLLAWDATDARGELFTHLPTVLYVL